MVDVPDGKEAVTAQWLGDVLGHRIAAVTMENLGEGVGVMAEVTRLHVTYERAQRDDGPQRPATLILKTASPAEQNRVAAVAYGFYRREVRFYEDIAGRLTLRVPRCYYAGMHESSVPFAIVMEEITGARTVDQLSDVALDDAQKVIDSIATLHARWWDAPGLDQLDWLPPVNNDQYKGFGEVMPQLVPVLRDKYGDRLEPEGFAILEGMLHAYPAFLDYWIDDGPVTFCHYDLRPDNILFAPPSDPDGICLLDWQLAVRHRGTFDIAYYLGQNVAPSFRRAHEQPLLRRYHDALIGLGVTGYSFDRCWDDYRCSMLMHVVSATQLAVLDGGNARGQQLLDAMVTAGWTAAVELGAGEFLARLAR